jgi:PAS domain S-box-containing protein
MSKTMSVKPDLDFLLQSINEALFTVDPGCRITSFNRAAEELTGYRTEEVLGRTCSEVFRSDLCESQCAMKESLTRGKRVPHRKVVMRHRSGQAVPISVSTSPIFDEDGWLQGAVETIRPINEVERLNEVLARETAQKMAILDSLAEGVITIDKNWKITSANAAAERILGVKATDLLGRICGTVLHADRCNDACPLARTLEQNDPARDELVHLTRADGRPIEVSMNVAVLRGPDGDAMGGVLSFREFTEVERLRAELAGEHHFHGIIGKSAAARKVFRLIEEVADSASTVLITGESGTGKEMAANALQLISSRRTGPYVKVNCAVFSDGVLESELFGHVKGAFTDACSDRRGRFELAHTGTLFLDEIGDISPRIQVKLLRVLQEKQFERVGGEEPVEVDVRIIAATHRDLAQLVREGTFREDLFYRLNVIPIHLPPLRDRREDIPLLVQHFLRKYQLVTGKNVERIHDRTLDVLVSHPWPGNVRQLENAVEYAFARARGEILTVDLLPPDVRAANPGRVASGPETGETWEIRRALERNHWHHGLTAKELGISRTTLWRKMKKLGLDQEG